MQKLELVDDLFENMLKGIKTNTLRWKEAEIQKGYLIFYASNNLSWKSLVWVQEIEKLPLNQSAHLYDMSAQELHKAMLRHYPDILFDSEVSYIKFLSPKDTIEKHGLPKDFEEEIIFSV